MSRGKRLLVAVLLLVITNIVCAQDSLKHTSFSLSVGGNEVLNKDEFQSPYTYRGASLHVNSNYTIRRGRREQVIDFTYSAGQVKSIVSPRADTKMLFLNYDYFYALKTSRTNRSFHISFGPGLHTFLSSTNYLPDVELPVRYSSASAYLTLSGKLASQLSKRSHVSMQLVLPVLGLVYRPDFEIDGKTLTKLTLPGKANLFCIDLGYEYGLRSRLTLKANYRYNYFTFDQPRHITILSNGISLGVMKNF